MEQSKEASMAVLIVLVYLFLLCPTSISTLVSLAKPGCQEKCGDITVPYPFGIIGGAGGQDCYKESYDTTCNTTFMPPKLFLGNVVGNPDEDVEVTDISWEGQLRVKSWVDYKCYNGGIWENWFAPLFNLTEERPYTFSDTLNKFTIVGCDIYAYFKGEKNKKSFRSGCAMLCTEIDNVSEESCSGIGCCQTSIPKGIKKFEVEFKSFNVSDFSQCSYAFLVQSDWYKFSVSDLSNGLNDNYGGKVPVVLDWSIGKESCKEAERNYKTYACGKNSYCYVSPNGIGYRCNCSQGYKGNPYLQNGCQDVNECEDSNNMPCKERRFCINKPEGKYTCTCPPGTHGNPYIEGDRASCVANPANPFPALQVALGSSIGVLILLSSSSGIYWGLHKRRLSKLREKFFKQNGGLLLKQQLSSYEGSRETAKIFSPEELAEATKNYDESRIIGRGGNGIVYKGILLDKREVAIKKARQVDGNQVEEFINEVVILSQINHINVVKLLGCCLETEIPVLVYEFINNGSLFHHIHDEGHESSISWKNRLSIAADTAGALAYLHSAASPPIIHRDVKSANILLGDNYTAKVADFGASRLVSLDQAQLYTLVQGTLGYLDPEYMQTNQLTEKSDVYSFGVVLLELLTGKTALSFARPEKEKNLAMHFITSIKENRLSEILEERVMREGTNEQLLEVVELAKRCLRVKGEDRPTMKEVAMELEGLRRFEKHLFIEQNLEETDYLLGESSNAYSTQNTIIGYDSLRDQVIIPLELDGGR